MLNPGAAGTFQSRTNVNTALVEEIQTEESLRENHLQTEWRASSNVPKYLGNRAASFRRTKLSFASSANVQYPN